MNTPCLGAAALAMLLGVIWPLQSHKQFVRGASPARSRNGFLVWLGLGLFTAGLLGWEVLPPVIPGLANDILPPSRIMATLWHLEVAKERRHAPPRLDAMSIAEMMALPTFPRFLTFAQLEEISVFEERGVTVAGFITRVYRAHDGDYHIHLTDVPAGRCLRHNAWDQLITELTPAFQARKPAYALAKLDALCGTETLIRVSGWLLYDATNQGRRGTRWEVHPISLIEVCCWKELS
jgi:hypothetical protein